MKLTLLLFALSGLVFAAPPDEQAVRDAVQAFNDAARKGDEATLNKLLSSQLVYVHSNWKAENKAECVAALVKSKPNFQLAPGFRVTVHGNSAVVHGKMTAINMQNGAPVKIELDVMQTWVKSGSGWQMVARHTARMPT
jgi:hypothetical protein